MAEFIGDKDNPYAIVVRAGYHQEGIAFYSPLDFPQQIGLMTRSKGSQVPPHTHNRIPRSIEVTQEVLLVRRGSCQISIFSEAGDFQESFTLNMGDVILLARGGHGIEFLEETEILEIKQGPYLGENDKTLL